MEEVERGTQASLANGVETIHRSASSRDFRYFCYKNLMRFAHSDDYIWAEKWYSDWMRNEMMWLNIKALLRVLRTANEIIYCAWLAANWANLKQGADRRAHRPFSSFAHFLHINSTCEWQWGQRIKCVRVQIKVYGWQVDVYVKVHQVVEAWKTCNVSEYSYISAAWRELRWSVNSW